MILITRLSHFFGTLLDLCEKRFGCNAEENSLNFKAFAAKQVGFMAGSPIHVNSPTLGNRPRNCFPKFITNTLKRGTRITLKRFQAVCQLVQQLYKKNYIIIDK